MMINVKKADLIILLPHHKKQRIHKFDTLGKIIPPQSLGYLQAEYSLRDLSLSVTFTANQLRFTNIKYTQRFAEVKKNKRQMSIARLKQNAERPLFPMIKFKIF